LVGGGGGGGGGERDQWELALFILANRKRHSSSFVKSL
jgi:hypothetical protein